MAPLYVTYGPDAYEILLNGNCAITHIIRYRHMRNSAGDFVDYEDLPQGLQQTITNRLLELIEE